MASKMDAARPWEGAWGHSHSGSGCSSFTFPWLRVLDAFWGGSGSVVSHVIVVFANRRHKSSQVLGFPSISLIGKRKKNKTKQRDRDFQTAGRQARSQASRTSVVSPLCSGTVTSFVAPSPGRHVRFHTNADPVIPTLRVMSGLFHVVAESLLSRCCQCRLGDVRRPLRSLHLVALRTGSVTTNTQARI